MFVTSSEMPHPLNKKEILLHSSLQEAGGTKGEFSLTRHLHKLVGERLLHRGLCAAHPHVCTTILRGSGRQKLESGEVATCTITERHNTHEA